MLVCTTRMLTQEVLIGATLYACAVAIRAASLGTKPFAVMLALVWMLLLFWGCRFGMRQPRCWSSAFTKGCRLYIGAICCANVLLTALNSRL